MTQTLHSIIGIITFSVFWFVFLRKKEWAMLNK